MKSWLLQTLFDIRYSYWFIPTLMAFAAIGLAVFMVSLDIYVFTEIPQGYEWLFRSQPSGARAILSTVAGSTITVAGVVFSMTIMSVSHATSNYGSRLLLKFLKDRRNQIALGTFTATFIYCLLVLRTVSSADIGSDATDFVPHLAILGALGLALASVAVLIAFIHHVPDSIHIGVVASDRGRELMDRLAEMFPEGSADTAHPQEPDAFISNQLFKVLSNDAGYLQTLDLKGLLKYCDKHDLVARTLKASGDFVYEDESLVEFVDLSGQLDEHNLQQFFGIGPERTPAQDTRFLVEELTQVAIRALSPGINDPFTAITCIDWLGNALARTINHAARPNVLADENDIARVVVPAFQFEDLCELIFAKLHPHVVRDSITNVHMAKVCGSIINHSQNLERSRLVRTYAESFLSEGQSFCNGEHDKALLTAAYEQQLRQVD